MSVQARKTTSIAVTRLFVVIVAGILLLPNPAEAGPFRSGVIGGLGGLAIGGIFGGGRGAAIGAIVGGVGGAIVGATSKNRRSRAVHRPYASVQRRAAPRPRVVAASPLISGIQGTLAGKGYNPGPVDGRMGPATAQAISAYQQSNGLLVTGQPSQALLNHMGSASAAKPIRPENSAATSSQ
jgi:putative peptidoglycan binding protein